jgi:hypothetical protein
MGINFQRFEIFDRNPSPPSKPYPVPILVYVYTSAIPRVPNSKSVVSYILCHPRKLKRQFQAA